MKFTVVFPSHENHDLSYGLVFIPCPVWVRGKKEILNLHPERPDYQFGGVRRLLEKEKIELSERASNQQCLLIVHQTGHAQQQDLDTLRNDLLQEGFQVNIVSFEPSSIFARKN